MVQSKKEIQEQHSAPDSMKDLEDAAKTEEAAPPAEEVDLDTMLKTPPPKGQEEEKSAPPPPPSAPPSSEVMQKRRDADMFYDALMGLEPDQMSHIIDVMSGKVSVNNGQDGVPTANRDVRELPRYENYSSNEEYERAMADHQSRQLDRYRQEFASDTKKIVRDLLAEERARNQTENRKNALAQAATRLRKEYGISERDYQSFVGFLNGDSNADPYERLKASYAVYRVMNEGGFRVPSRAGSSTGVEDQNQSGLPSSMTTLGGADYANPDENQAFSDFLKKAYEDHNKFNLG